MSLEPRPVGYENLNDREQLRRDPLLAVGFEKSDPLGHDRLHDRCAVLVAPGTPNRLELSHSTQTRGHKLPHDPVGRISWHIRFSRCGESFQLLSHTAAKQALVFAAQRGHMQPLRENSSKGVRRGWKHA